jgi:hypothetical protein
MSRASLPHDPGTGLTDAVSHVASDGREDTPFSDLSVLTVRAGAES